MKRLKIISRFFLLFLLYNVALPSLIWFINSQIIYLFIWLLFDEITWWVTMKILAIAYFAVSFYKFQINNLDKYNIIKRLNNDK